MTQRRALGDLEFDSAFDDPDNGWFGHVQAEDPMLLRAPAEVADPPRDHGLADVGADGAEDTDRWPVLTVDGGLARDVDDAPTGQVPTGEVPTVEVPTGGVPTGGVPTGGVLDGGQSDQPEIARWSDVSAAPNGRFEAPPQATWESRLARSDAWDFKVPASGPSYRMKMALAALIVAGVAVVGVVLLIRSPGAAVEESTVVPPNESSAQPSPSSTVPVPSDSSEAPPPPGPPAPPPPPAEEISPPTGARDYTPRRQYAPDESSKPEIDVTRTPTTRSQMSATPPPPPPNSDRNSSTPGDSPSRHRFGFGF